MIGAALLRAHTYEEVEHDSAATKQAAIVVVMVAVATGIGSLSLGMTALIFGIVAGIVQWALWAFVTYVLGTTLFNTPQTEANWAQLARTTGFAQTPGLLRIFGFIPFIGPLLATIGTVWQFVAMVVAVKQALDYTSKWRAVGVVLVGFILIAILNLIFAGIFLF
ncbi:MAG: YIP1 family protein [Chloroflexi bacterium]|nr:YIP1 family protein [Chloroflexota bacterium]